MTTYIADTHALIFFLGSPQRLRKDGRQAFDEAVAGHAEVVIPVIVFAELIFAVERGRVAVDVAQIIDRVQDMPNFHIVPLTLQRVMQLQTLTAIPELHDRMIVCETLAQQGVLITRDARIRRSGVVPTVW